METNSKTQSGQYSNEPMDFSNPNKFFEYMKSMIHPSVERIQNNEKNLSNQPPKMNPEINLHGRMYDLSTLEGCTALCEVMSLQGPFIDRDGQIISVSSVWKLVCMQLPCFPALWWKGYYTAYKEVKIDGHDVVIQLWKGHCQRFLDVPFISNNAFPGGYGVEVGIYYKDVGRSVIALAPGPLKSWLIVYGASKGAMWWPWWDGPYNKLNPKISVDVKFKNQPFFKHGEESTWWKTRWFDNDGMYNYLKANFNGISWEASMANDIDLHFTVNGIKYKWIGGSEVIELDT